MRLVGKDYQTTVIVDKKGRTESGIVKGENDTAVTLQTPTKLVKIDKAEIDERELSTLSLMPEGQLKTLKDNEILDLIGYLQSSAQVPLPGEGPAIDASGKVTDAIEGENIRSSGKINGKWASQAMNSFESRKMERCFAKAGGLVGKPVTSSHWEYTSPRKVDTKSLSGSPKHLTMRL